MAKIYVASSWRNDYQPSVVDRLREAGHEVYDFRHPDSGGPVGVQGATRKRGFHWSEIDESWQWWTPQEFRDAIMEHPLAEEGFASDADALIWCDICVLVLPCGRSAHLEAGWAAGAGKPLVILLPSERQEPELMYLFAHTICLSHDELVEVLAARPGDGPREGVR